MPKSPPKKKSTPKKPNGMTLKKIAGKAAQYLQHSKEGKEIDKRKKTLSSELKEYAESLGDQNDTGSFVLELPGGFKVSKVASKTASIDEDSCLDILNKNGLFNRCTKTVVDAKEVEACVSEGLISVEDAKQFTNFKVSYRIDVRGP
ncbi:MAG: hypothetical protein GF334_12420 [Candidatus Altiarchaeales archaeon]|nr:hypothetical protein [Candidatus Altiarchaeales archaeon]